jgi:DNA anti-recombination protein RmuC
MSAVSENLKSEYSQKFASYSGEVEGRLENIHDEMSAVSENLKSEYSQKFATYSGEVEERLENIHEEISEKVESGVLDVISEFNEKINAKVEELHKERELVDSKVWESLCSYEEKLKVFAEEAAQSERVYEMRLDEFAQKLLSQQASLEEVSSEQLESLRGKYNQLSAEISAYQVEMYSEIDERTRRGLSELEKGLAERLSQLSQKEKECSDLLKEESRTYTNLFENVYSQTLAEQKAFEKKIRE